MYQAIALFFLLILFSSKVQGCDLEKQMINNGLVDIKTLDTSITVEIINATDNNMLGANLYGCLKKCFLQPEAAKKVIEAQRILEKKHPGCYLKILDGARPRSVQEKMYDVVKNTSIKKFVADPLKGSMHNFGTAIDLTIVDSTGKELDMGQPDPRDKIVGKSDLELRLSFLISKISNTQKRNRALLKSVMTEAGFFPISYEWWHFDAFMKNYARSNFRIIE